MAAGVSKLMFLFLLSLLLCSSGLSSSSSSSSTIKAVPLIKLVKGFNSQFLPNSGEHVYFYLDQTQVESLLNSKPYAISWLKNHIKPDIRGIALCGNCYDQTEWHKLLSNLNSLRSILKSLQLGNKFEVSVVFSLSGLEGLSKTYGKEKVFGFLKEIRSYVIVEADIDGQVNRGEYRILPLSRRELLTSNFRATLRDATYPPITTAPNPIVTVPATNPITITPNPDATPIPTTPITVPGNPPVPITNPVTAPVINPVTTPVTNPVTTPVPVTTNPVTTPAPITVPGVQTNPVTTYPGPAGNVPVMTPPGLNPVMAPPTTNVPAIPGQSWCVAITGTDQAALQSALDYACGMGGVDCSQIQQGGSCYNPSTLQNHASYAFNSYYQKNPVPTSCDFGGTAMIVNNNPIGAGSCIYLTSASSSSATPATPTPLPTSTTPPTTPITNPVTTPTNPVTTPITNPVTTPTNPITTPITNPVTNPTMPAAPPGGAGFSGYGSSPSVANVYGSQIPPAVISPTSTSIGLKPFIGCIVLITSIVTRTIIFSA